jgi:hypothetical protein
MKIPCFEGLGALLWTVLALGSPMVLGHSPVLAQEKVCHVLVFADTNDANIGESVALDASGIERLFTAHIPAERLRISEPYVAYRLSRAAMLNAIAGHRLRPEVDTLVVYFGGHGSWDVTREDGHRVKARDEYVYRSEIRQAMDKTGARLKILLTDCCSNLVRPRVRPLVIERTITPPAQTAAAFVTLFWNPVGFIDINSSARGQVAMGDNMLGGYFTSCFTGHLWDNSQRDGLTWANTIERVRTATAKKFVERHPDGVPFRSGGQLITQKTQTIAARLEISSEPSTPPDVPPPPPPAQPQGPRFGVRAMQMANQVKVMEVFDNTPAKRVQVVGTNQVASLEVGDVLVSINGQPIRSEQDFTRAVDQSGRTMRLVILDHKNNRQYELIVTLAY